MASITAVTAAHATLTAATVDTVTLSGKSRGTGPATRVTISNPVAAAATIYVTGDGSTPTVGGNNTVAVVAQGSKTITFFGTVKLISSGTPVYDVEIVHGS